MLPNDRHGAGVSARDRHGARELHRTLINTVASRQVRGATADDIRATCAEMPTLAHGFRIERPSERMYFQRRRSFPSTGDWLVDAEHRVNENAIVLHESFGGGARAYLVAMQGTRSSSSPSRGPPPSADLSARADMPASALRRSIRGPRATRGVPAAVLRTCLRAKGDWRRGAGRDERVLATTAKFS